MKVLLLRKVRMPSREIPENTLAFFLSDPARNRQITLYNMNQEAQRHPTANQLTLTSRIDA